MIIRKAKPEDSAALLPMAIDLATSFVVAPDAFRSSFRQCLIEESSLVLVAEVDSSLAGYLLGSDHLTFFANGRVAAVEEVYVSPGHRTKGIGKALMRAFENWAEARGSAQIVVNTRRAALFYKALGYEETATCLRYLLRNQPEQAHSEATSESAS